MPELPEVETTRRGISPHLKDQCINKIIIHNAQLRWPIPKSLLRTLPGQTISDITRRGKYLLLETQKGTLIMHLGMSGSMCITAANEPVRKHDHFELILNNGQCLRFHDPRRFGSILWTTSDPLQHKLLSKLGPEPDDQLFTGEYLWQRAQNKRITIKAFIMNSHIVVGVGNIYASESLFNAGIHPKRAAGRISRGRFDDLAQAIKEVISAAIRQGGTSLRDFTNAEGKPGYFKQALNVYGRQNEACHQCGQMIKHCVIGQRASYYCSKCQK